MFLTIKMTLQQAKRPLTSAFLLKKMRFKGSICRVSVRNLLIMSRKHWSDPGGASKKPPYRLILLIKKRRLGRMQKVSDAQAPVAQLDRAAVS